MLSWKVSNALSYLEKSFILDISPGLKCTPGISSIVKSV